jgi:hypothetical protein
MTQRKTLRIAVLPDDGLGNETIPGCLDLLSDSVPAEVFKSVSRCCCDSFIAIYPRPRHSDLLLASAPGLDLQTIKYRVVATVSSTVSPQRTDQITVDGRLATKVPRHPVWNHGG